MKPTKEEILSVCAEQLVEIGENRLARQLLGLLNEKDPAPIIFEGVYADTGLSGHVLIGRIQGKARGYSREGAIEKATEEMQKRARSRGVYVLCGVHIVQARSRRAHGDSWEAAVVGNAYA